MSQGSQSNFTGPVRRTNRFTPVSQTTNPTTPTPTATGDSPDLEPPRFEVINCDEMFAVNNMGCLQKVDGGDAYLKMNFELMSMLSRFIARHNNDQNHHNPVLHAIQRSLETRVKESPVYELIQQKIRSGAQDTE